MTGSLILKLNGKTPVVGVISGEMKVDTSTPLNVDVVEKEFKLRVINESPLMQTGDELIYYFPLFEDSTDEPFTGNSPAAGYKMSGHLHSVEIGVMIHEDILNINSIYEVDVYLEFWDIKRAQYMRLKLGKIFASEARTGGGGNASASVGGLPGIYTDKIKIPVSREITDTDDIDHRARLVLNNIGDDVNLNVVVNYDVIHLEEVIP